MTATAVLPRLIRPYLGLELISEELQTRLVNRIVKDHELTLDEATDILDAAIGFLKLCADHPGHGFSPSRQVDIGWHTFLMYTRDYAEFCERVAGHFIHHEPNDVPGLVEVTEAAGQIGGSRDTVMFMREHGIAFSPTLWGVSDASECASRCYECTEQPMCGSTGSKKVALESTRECCHGCGTGKPGPVTAVVAENSRECVDPCHGESARCHSGEPEPHKRSATGN